MASRKRKPSKQKNPACVSSRSIAGLREATSRWSDVSDALCAATGDDDVSVPILLRKKIAIADDLSEDFFSQPVSFQRSIAIGTGDTFADLQPPDEQLWLTPAMKARRKKLRSMVTALVASAAVLLTVGIAKQSIPERAAAAMSLATSTETVRTQAHSVGRPAKRPTAATHLAQRGRRR
jgi:hypothetical protein